MLTAGLSQALSGAAFVVREMDLPAHGPLMLDDLPEQAYRRRG